MPKRKTSVEPKTKSDVEELFAYLFAPSELPSEAKHAAWLMAPSPKQAFSSSDVSGKWCIFKPSSEIDAAWNLIKAAVKRCDLLVAKVSTKLGAYAHGNNHVICVYTEDYTDEAELARTRKVLRELGFTEELGYKRDIDTRNNVYGPDEWYRKAI